MRVKPEVLPENPVSLIDPDKPVLYLLEMGGIADRTALQSACEQHNLPDPRDSLVFGTETERSSVDVLPKKRSGLLFGRRVRVVSNRLSRLVSAGTTSQDTGELQIVPVAIYWGRAPKKVDSIWRWIFTDSWELTSRTRRFITALLHGKNTLIVFSEPLSFESLKSSGEPKEILIRKLARILRVHFRQRKIATLGPDQSHRRTLINHVLNDPAVKSAIELSNTSDAAKKRLRKKAYTYAYEIAADVSYPAVRIMHRLLTRLWNQLYDGVKLSGIDRLKAVADGNEIVYVPCHRSHIDYLLLSYILYVQGFSLPHIAAGVNLNLPIIGPLLRRGGAFFLRRSFAGNPLYATVFNAYLKQILQRGNALEYFVEGGRSRTGRLLPAKGGMLAMTVYAFLQRPHTPVVFIPVYFGYERLLEGKAFTSELAGGRKQKESFFGLLRSLKTLKEDYGQVYVNIGNPIALNTLLDQHHPNWRSIEIDESRPEWLKPIVDQLGNQIMCSINEATSVTPISLLATTLLATPQGCLSYEELLQQIEFYQQLLKITHNGSLVEVPDIDPTQLIEHGVRLGFTQRYNDNLGGMVQLRDNQAAPLTYFRNNILHLLTLPALIAAAFTNQRKRTESELVHLVTVTYPFLQSELFSPTTVETLAINQTLEALSSANLIKQDNEGYWRRAAAGSVEAVTLLRLAEVVKPALERDYLCACIIAGSTDEGLTKELLAERCKQSAQRLANTHGRLVEDLYDKHLHQAFVDNLIMHQFIETNNELIFARDTMLKLQKEAHSLLDENMRHAIIFASVAASQYTL